MKMTKCTLVQKYSLVETPDTNTTLYPRYNLTFTFGYLMLNANK